LACSRRQLIFWRFGLFGYLSRGYRGIYPPVGGEIFRNDSVMAYYIHLPIYKKAIETAVYFENLVRNFSRYNKYNLGAEMRTKSRDIVKLIIKANSSRNKLPLLL
jgi:hypothetical protein